MTSEKYQLYVKDTSNCGGLPLTSFERLGPVWSGESLMLPFGVRTETRMLEVVGWSDLFFGSPAPVHVFKTRLDNQVGYLVYGGNSGVRVLNDETEPVEGIDSHLPPGWGQPVIWIEDVADLPCEVAAVIEPQTGTSLCVGCGEVFSLATEGWMEVGDGDLCPDCARQMDEEAGAEIRLQELGLA